LTQNHIQPHITEYIDGSLDSQKRERVKSHMIFCHPCRQYLTEIEHNIGLLKSFPLVEPPEHLPGELIKINPPGQVPLQKESKTDASKSSKPRPPGWGWIFSLTALILLSFLWTQVLHRKSSVKISKSPSSTQAPIEKPSPINKEEPIEEVYSEQHENSSISIPTTENLEYFSEIKGPDSAIKKPKELVISTPRAWKKIWKKHVKNQDPRPPLPPVDFEKNVILALFAGTQTSGLDTLKIQDIRQTTWDGDPAQIVNYSLISSQGETHKSVEYQPFIIKLQPKSENQTFFRQIP